MIYIKNNLATRKYFCHMTVTPYTINQVSFSEIGQLWVDVETLTNVAIKKLP